MSGGPGGEAGFQERENRGVNFDPVREVAIFVGQNMGVRGHELRDIRSSMQAQCAGKDKEGERSSFMGCVILIFLCQLYDGE